MVRSDACKLSKYILVSEHWNCWNNTSGPLTSVGLPAANSAEQKFSAQISVMAVKTISVAHERKKKVITHGRNLKQKKGLGLE